MEIDRAIFALIGPTEIMWISILVLILFGAKKVPELRCGVRKGFREFHFSFDQFLEELKASGQSRESDFVAEALTPDNQSAEFLQPPEKEEDVKSKLIVWVAQGFGIGRIPFAPGTWGSVLGVVWSIVLLEAFPPAAVVLTVLVSSLFAVWCCGRAEQILGEKDPGSIVLDEIVAMPLVYAGLWFWQTSNFSDGWSFWFIAKPVDLVEMAQATWPALLGGFALFRLFDIWKPWPIRPLQRLPGGWGVVVDDLAAGLVAGVALFLGWYAAMYVFYAA